MEIKADEHMSDRFSISYGAKQTYYFETGLSNRAAWVSGITKKKFETAATVESIRASAAYIASLKALEDGSAFHKVHAIEGAHEVFSDEDDNDATTQVPAVECPESSTEDKSSERPKGRRASSFLKTLKEKTHHDKATTESAQDGPEVPEKTPKKDKRRSFLAGFIGKRETSTAPVVAEREACSPETSAPATAPELTVEHKEAPPHMETECANVDELEKRTPEKNPVGTSGTAKSPLSPFKEKVDGFFSKFKKSHDKDQIGTSCNTETSQVSATDDAMQPEESTAQVDSCVLPAEPEIAESSATTEADIGSCGDRCVASQTVIAPAEPEQEHKADDMDLHPGITSRFDTDIEVDEKKPIGLARRLTSLFKAKKSGKQQLPPSTAVTSDGPPQVCPQKTFPILLLTESSYQRPPSSHQSRSQQRRWKL